MIRSAPGPDRGNDAVARRLRAQLDDELAGVRADRRALADVLARPARRRRWPLPGGVPAWSVLGAAAAAAAVALAVPALRPPGGPDRLAGPTPSAPVGPAPSATASPTDSPFPSLSPAATPSQAPACLPPRPSPGAGGLQVDLDGDGRPDTVRYDTADRALRVTLSGGRGDVTAGFGTASPYLTVLPVRTDSRPGAEVLIGTRGAVGSQGGIGVRARLYALRGCTFAPVLGVNGQPYDFEVGVASGTQRSGVVCDGGVLYGRTSTLSGGVWRVTDTPVSSSSGTAVNGRPRTSTVPDGTPQAQDLARESCDGEPQPLG